MTIATQSTQDRAAVDNFSSIKIDDEGLNYAYSRKGTGAPILVLVGNLDAYAPQFYALLAERFEVTLVDTADAKLTKQELATVTSALGIDAPTLICSGKAAGAGLGLALASPAAVSRLILIAPELTADQNFAAVATPVLVLEGTVDRTEADAIGQRLAGTLPECYDILVYDAGPALAAERPEATASVVSDFVERGGGFTVTKPQGPLHP